MGVLGMADRLVMKAIAKASGNPDDKVEKLTVEPVETDWYITGNHPMRKDDYVSFLALAAGDRVQVVKLYPEWDLQARIPARGHGMLLWYSHRQGLLYQLV